MNYLFAYIEGVRSQTARLLFNVSCFILKSNLNHNKYNTNTQIFTMFTKFNLKGMLHSKSIK